MEIDLRDIYDKLEILRIDLRKLGPERRQQSIGKNKINKANELYTNYREIICSVDFSQFIGEYSHYINEILCNKIEEVYSKILEYSKEREKRKLVQMAEKFDLREAGSLIPVMEDREETIQKIIAGIEMMDNILKEPDNKKMLITFVLKTRLNNAAKLKLNSKYETVKQLVTDITKYLLPKKSANSLLIQLNNVTQKDMSIDKYGEKIEELFIGLTIAQADGKPEACEVLRPINESLAIKKFADGLRNRRLSTILAARQYTDLKEAIRAAQDEELAQPQRDSTVMSMRNACSPRRGYHRPPRWNWRASSGRYATRPPNAYFPPNTYHGMPNYNYNRRGNVPNQNYYRALGQRSNFRGSRGGQNSRGRRGNVFTTAHDQVQEENEEVKFFRP